MRITKAFFRGAKGRVALRSMVRRAVAAQNKTGLEHGFHAGRAGVDTKLERGKAGGIRWSPRASVGQMQAGGALHHTHPRGFGRLSPQDLRSVVTSPAAAGGRNTLWAHSDDGHEAARLTRRAARKPVAFRAKAFARAFRNTKGQGLNALRLRLKRYGLINTASTIRKAARRARGLLPRGGTRTMRGAFRRALGQAKRDTRYAMKFVGLGPYFTEASTRQAAWANFRNAVTNEEGAKHVLRYLRQRSRRIRKAIAKAKRHLRGYHGPPQTVVRGGRAMTLRAGQPFRTSLRGGSADLIEAARGGKAVSPKYRGKRDGDLNNDGKPDGTGRKQRGPHQLGDRNLAVATGRDAAGRLPSITPEWPPRVWSPESLSSRFRQLKAPPVLDKIASIGAVRRVARDLNIALDQVHFFRTGPDEWTAWARKGEKLRPFEDVPLLPKRSVMGETDAFAAKRPSRATPAKPKAKRATSIRAKLEQRIERAPADVPKNKIPAGAKLAAARPIGAGGERVKAAIAARDEEVTTSWGAKLKARAGKDYVLENGPDDRWVVRGDLFKATYKANDDGSFSKDPKQIAGFWIAPKAMTIKTLEGPVRADAGDHVMVGAIGEMWPVKPATFNAKYKLVRLRKARADLKEIDL